MVYIMFPSDDIGR